jgi:putative ABC transport system permease protein
MRMFRLSSLSALVEADVSPLAHIGLVAATAGLAVLVGILAGAYPSWYVTSFPPVLALKGNFGLSPKGRVLRNALIGVQFVASFVLVIGASFMFLQNYYMQHSPLGYDKDQLITVTHLTGKVQENHGAFINRLESFAGIEDVTTAQNVISGSDQYMRWGRGYHGEEIHYQCIPVDPSFLKALGIEVKEGRDFRPEDGNTRHGAYIFNEKARQAYGLKLNDHIDSAEIVGFIPDIKFASFRKEVEPMAFLVWGMISNQNHVAYIKVKAGSDLRAARVHVQETLRAFDGEYPFNVRFYDDVLNRLYEKERSLSSLITIFSIVAILISIVGVFGLVIFDSEYRRKEISIRKVFGSTTHEILALFNKVYIRILCICFIVATPVAWYAVTKWLESFAYKTPMYWWVYAIAFAIVFILTVATVTFQNWRAANMNPVDAINN